MKQNSQNVDYRLGELLVDLGVTSATEITKGLKVAAHTSLPLGKTLVMLDCVPDYVIRSVVEAQSMLRDRLLELGQAKQAVGIVKRKRWTFSEALISLGVDAGTTKGTRLGELLRDAGKIDAQQLEMGLAIADYSGLPLGQVLILLNKVTEDKVRLTLSLQRELRASNLERKDAVRRLSTADSADETGTSLPALTVTPAIKIKLGELLTEAEVVSDDHVKEAIRSNRDNKKMLGQILVEKQRISSDLLTAALRLQSLIWSNFISIPKAAAVLREAHRLEGAPDALATDVDGLLDREAKKISLYDFLRITGYLTREKIRASVEKIKEDPRLLAYVMSHAKNANEAERSPLEEATELALRDTAALRAIFNETHPEDRPLVDSALVFHQLVQERKLTLCQALVNFSIKINGIGAEPLHA
ncbi:MAG: hypothetical protein K2X93_22930 [Candidatus Obscuribacterales bacterium]|nr:hypothetical protein [Candidatus Obscuribacterales bacterium]